MARRHRPGCLPRPAHGRAWTRAPWGGLVNDTALIRLLTRAALLAAVWAAAVTVMRRLRHRRRRPRCARVSAPPPPAPGGAGRLARGVAPPAQAPADGVAGRLDGAAIDRAHIAGTALGGWIALDRARRGRARSVVLFGPAGAW